MNALVTKSVSTTARPFYRLLATTGRLLLLAIACSVIMAGDADAAERYSTGWRPSGGAVQWKVQQYDSKYGQGTEIRYYFRNNTSKPVTIRGAFRYTSTEGKSRLEEYLVTVKPHSKRGGNWDGKVFFAQNSSAWRMIDFRY